MQPSEWQARKKAGMSGPPAEEDDVLTIRAEMEDLMRRRSKDKSRELSTEERNLIERYKLGGMRTQTLTINDFMASRGWWREDQRDLAAAKERGNYKPLD